MTSFDVKRLALVLAVQAEIESMKVANEQRKYFNERPLYSELDFFEKAKELREIVKDMPDTHEVRLTYDGLHTLQRAKSVLRQSKKQLNS